MLLTTLAFAAALGQEPLGELLDVARPHVWRIVMETPDASIAVMADIPEAAGTRRDLWILFTISEDFRQRNNGTARQVYLLRGADCEAHTQREILMTDADPARPPRAAVPLQERSYTSEDVPPLPIMATPRPYRPVDPASPFGRALGVACGDDPSGYPSVEGDWSGVMSALLTRQDAAGRAD